MIILRAFRGASLVEEELMLALIRNAEVDLLAEDERGPSHGILSRVLGCFHSLLAVVGVRPSPRGPQVAPPAPRAPAAANAAGAPITTARNGYLAGRPALKIPTASLGAHHARGREVFI